MQDDWQISPSVKLLYGVRYDLYKYPDGIADAPLAQTHEFNTDRNNFGPRAGVAWSIDDKTVLRGSTGIMYDQADPWRLRTGAAVVRVAAGADLHPQRHAGRRAGVPNHG